LTISYLFLKFFFSSYEDDAESRCETAMNQALFYRPDSLDGLLLKANLRLSQRRNDEAGEVIRIVANKLLGLLRHLHSRSLVSELSEEEDISIAEAGNIQHLTGPNST